MSAAARGSTVILTASGVGQLGAGGSPILPVSMTIGGKSAQVTYARPAEGQIGVLEIEVRIPADLPLTSTVQRVETILTAGSYTSRSGIFVWVR